MPGVAGPGPARRPGARWRRRRPEPAGACRAARYRCATAAGASRPARRGGSRGACAHLQRRRTTRLRAGRGGRDGVVGTRRSLQCGARVLPLGLSRQTGCRHGRVRAARACSGFDAGGLTNVRPHVAKATKRRRDQLKHRGLGVVEQLGRAARSHAAGTRARRLAADVPRMAGREGARVAQPQRGQTQRPLWGPGLDPVARARVAVQPAAVATMMRPAPKVEWLCAKHAARADLVGQPRLLRVAAVGRGERRRAELVRPPLLAARAMIRSDQVGRCRRQRPTTLEVGR